MPIMKFKSNAKPSLFDYPPKVKPPTKDAPTKVSTAVLSVTNKKDKKKDKKKDGMDVSFFQIQWFLEIIYSCFSFFFSKKILID